MRILHVTPSFYPAWAYGGVTRCAYELCDALARRGEDVTVWTTDAYDAGHRLPASAAAPPGIVVCRFPNLSNHLAYALQLYVPRGLWAHARRHVGEFDLVHLHAHRHLLNVLVVAAARRAGVPYVFTGHGTVPAIERHVWVKHLVDALGARDVLRGAASCIAVSEAEVSQYGAAGVEPARIQVIPNGIQLSAFHDLPPRGTFRRAREFGDGPLVAFVGKITPRKGVDVLIRALRRLPSDVRLVVAGNFMMPSPPLHRLTRDLGLADRVHFVGALSEADKLAAYVDADVVAYPSVHEIFGLVPFEALMCGTPVVVCDDSGCGAVVQEAGGGLLVPYGDDRALADALQRLFEDRVLAQRCSASGARYVTRHLGWDGIAEQTLALYHEAMAGRDHRAEPRSSARQGHAART